MALPPIWLCSHHLTPNFSLAVHSVKLPYDQHCRGHRSFASSSYRPCTVFPMQPASLADLTAFVSISVAFMNTVEIADRVLVFETVVAGLRAILEHTGNPKNTCRAFTNSGLQWHIVLLCLSTYTFRLCHRKPMPTWPFRSPGVYVYIYTYIYIYIYIYT